MDKTLTNHVLRCKQIKVSNNYNNPKYHLLQFKITSLNTIILKYISAS